MAKQIELTRAQYFKLEWLSKHHACTYGECKGKTLDALVACGFVVVNQTSRRAKEQWKVEVTKAGRDYLSGDDEPAAEPPAAEPVAETPAEPFTNSRENTA